MAKKARLEARIGLNSTAFQRGLAKLRRAAGRFAKGFGRALASAGKALAILSIAGIAAAVAGITLLIKRTAAYGDVIDKMAKRTGTSVEFLQKLKHAAELGGSSLEGMEKAIRTLAKATTEADDGMATYSDEFDKLGVSVRNTSGQLKNTETIFVEVAKALAKVENSTARVSIAQQLLGRSGTQVLAIMADGADAFVDAMQEAEDLGLIMSPQDVKNAAEFTDQMTRTKGVLAGIGRNFAAALLPSLNAALVTFRQRVQELRATGLFVEVRANIEKGAAMFMAAAELFARAPNKLQIIGTMIVSAFVVGTEIFTNGLKKAMAETAVGKLLGLGAGAVRGAGAAAGGLSTGQSGLETGKQIADAWRDNGIKSSTEIAAKFKKDMSDVFAGVAAEQGTTIAELVAKYTKAIDENAKKLAAAGGGGDAAKQQFSELRKIGANIIGGNAVKGVEEKQLSQLEKMRKSMSDLVQIVRDRNQRRTGAQF